MSLVQIPNTMKTTKKTKLNAFKIDSFVTEVNKTTAVKDIKGGAYATAGGCTTGYHFC